MAMKIRFIKYHGAGNDFIVTFGGKKGHGLSEEQIAFLCQRHTGIGADGYVEILNSRTDDFAVRYHNADGRAGSLCGNGSRCAVHYARKMGLCRRHATFQAADGRHEGVVINKTTVRISMHDVQLNINPQPLFIDTGSPHVIFQVDDVNGIDVVQQGRSIRYSETYRAEGVNVNFMSLKDGQVRLRTYERGVEAETLSCGSGAVAAAVAAALFQNRFGDDLVIPVITRGGVLQVSFRRKDPLVFSDIWLEGPVMPVFSGVVSLKGQKAAKSHSTFQILLDPRSMRASLEA